MRAPATFASIVVDCPWRFGDSLPGPGRGAEKHYATLSVAELELFPLPPIADDAYLFFWRVASMQQEALDVIRAWDFTLKTEIVWRKQTVTGKRWFGMGRTVRAEHETCLVATRGRPQVLSKSIRSTFEAPVPDGRHSAKPEAFFDLVESLVPGPYVELFARRVRPGWTCLGNDPALLELQQQPYPSTTPTVGAFMTRPAIQTFIPGTEPPDAGRSDAVDEIVYAWLDSREEQKRHGESTKIRHATLLAKLAELGLERYPYLERTSGKKRYVAADRTPKVKIIRPPQLRMGRRGKKIRVERADSDAPAKETAAEKDANTVEHRKVPRKSVEKEIDGFAQVRSDMGKNGA